VPGKKIAIKDLGSILSTKNVRFENFSEKSENSKPANFLRKVRKNILLLFWLGQLFRGIEMFSKAVS
jgi:hypothetical protein